MVSDRSTETGGRNSRGGLPPWVFDGKTGVGPRMEDARQRQVGRRQPRGSLPRGPVLLAATPKRTPPEFSHVEAECGPTRVVVWPRVGHEVTTYPPPPPPPLLRGRVLQ